jgi:hypothetical protein
LTYWPLKSSFGVLTGVAENARSGRNDVTNEPIIEDMVGEESSEISWYALKYMMSRRELFQKITVIASPRGGRCCELSSPAHLAQYLNIRDLSDMTEERVELCCIRLVKIRQECKQKQRFECESPRLPSPDYLE